MAMATKAFGNRLLQAMRELQAANSANVTLTFALVAVPMIGLVGAAVDYSHANSVKAAMQAAADSSALMLSKDASTLSNSQLQMKANEYFKVLFNRAEATGLTITATYTTSSGSMLKIDATSNVKTTFMNLMGFSTMKIGVDSYVKWGNSRLRVALALDNTGSMKDDGKMEALKKATKGLLDQLKSASGKAGDVYVSIVPFNKDVNVSDIGTYTDKWLRWDLWEESNGKCSGISKSGDYKTKTDCTEALGLWTADDHKKWNGCVADRDQSYDTTNDAPATGLLGTPLKPETLFPAEEFASCPEALMALSYDWNALEKKVDKMKPDGMTNQTIGLQWAFQSLTASPFTIPAKDAKYKYSEIIILMSDGLNTQNRFSKDQAAIDAREDVACANAKKAGITIYAVQVNTGGDPTQLVMKNCASDSGKFFELKSANALVSTFNSIGVTLSNLRIAQ
jgi:Flp pilus assembly protein TadG